MHELPPIVSVDPGDTIAFSCPNAGWEYEHGVRFEPYDEELDTGHALVGPVEVRSAKAGGTLVVRVDSVVPGPWGVTLAHAPTRIEWPPTIPSPRCSGCWTAGPCPAPRCAGLPRRRVRRRAPPVHDRERVVLV